MLISGVYHHLDSREANSSICFYQLKQMFKLFPKCHYLSRHLRECLSICVQPWEAKLSIYRIEKKRKILIEKKKKIFQKETIWMKVSGRYEVFRRGGRRPQVYDHTPWMEFAGVIAVNHQEFRIRTENSIINISWMSPHNFMLQFTLCALLSEYWQENLPNETN